MDSNVFAARTAGRHSGVNVFDLFEPKHLERLLDRGDQRVVRPVKNVVLPSLFGARDGNPFAKGLDMFFVLPFCKHDLKLSSTTPGSSYVTS